MARLNGKDVPLLLEDFDQLRQQRRGILRGKPLPKTTRAGAIRDGKLLGGKTLNSND